jgi:ADP-heptose:LPS heptosyltransferase
MPTTATAKYSEALAQEIAAPITRAVHGVAKVTVRFDRLAETHAVRVAFTGRRYDLLIPAPGACYALFRDDAWLGGMNLTTDALPADVANALLDRIAATI